MTALVATLAAVAMLVASSPAGAEFYKWTDERGQVNVTDDYYKVPPKYRGKVEVKRLEDSGRRPEADLNANDAQRPTEPASNQPTGRAGAAEASWKDWNGHGADYWLGRQRDLQAKAADVDRRLKADKEAIKALSSSRAAAVGGRRDRGRIEGEIQQLETESSEVNRMLKSGLADEALRSGVPPEFSGSLRSF
jgi:hypothetical protein